MAAKRTPDDDGFVEIEFEDASTSDARPHLPIPSLAEERTDTKNRRRLPLVVSAVFAVLAVGGYVFLSKNPQQHAPDAAFPTPSASQTQSAPHPDVETGPVVTVTDRERLLHEPNQAWDRFGEGFTLLSGGHGHVSSTNATSRNTSDAVVLTYLNENGRPELFSVDAPTGTVLWRLSPDEGVERCTLLADGHQVGCIAKGGTRSYVTVLSSRTGESFGTSAWQTDCIAEDIAGEASNLIIAGYTLSANEPCLASGPVWDQEQRVLVYDGASKNVDPDFPSVSLEHVSGHLIAFFDDQQFIVDQALTRMVPGASSSWLALDEVMGPYEIRMNESREPVDDSGEYFAQHAFLRFLEPVSYETQSSPEFLGLPWVRIGWGLKENGQPEVIGIGNAVFDNKGELLWEMSPADASAMSVYMSPDVAVRVLTTYEETQVDSDSSDGTGHDQISTSTITAYDLLSGTLLWTSTVDGDLSIQEVFGDASIWVQFSPGGGALVRGLDLRTGDWTWTLPEEKEKVLGQFDYSELTVIGDVLIRMGYGAISAFTFES